jgi:hypothetical protein
MILKNGNANDILQNIEYLDTAEMVGLIDTKSREVKNQRGIWSNNFQQHVGVVSNKYGLIQHKDVFEPIVKAMCLGTNKLMYEIKETPGHAHMYVALPEQFSMKGPDGKLMQFGFFTSNTYDGEGALNIAAFGFRVVCSNGMALGKSLGQVSIRHLGDIEVVATNFLQELDKRIASLFETISRANEMMYDIETVSDYLEETYGQRNRDKIISLFANEPRTAWGVYNAVTDFYSHNTRVNPDTQLRELRNSEDILLEPQMIQVVAENRRKQNERTRNIATSND